MTTNMDRSLDEILADRKKTGGRGGRGRGNNNNNSSNGRNGSDGGRRRERRDEYPRDGVRKSYRDDSRKIDEEWVHDRYDDDAVRHKPSWTSHDEPDRGFARGTKLRVENLHYELTRDDIDGLFQRIGPVLSTELVYDRAGRSEGVAFVTYEIYDDAKEAIREFDGANAKGQPIRLTIVPSGRRNNPFDSAVKPVGTGRPLAERISRPGGGRRNRGAGDDRDDYEDENDDEEGKNSMAAAARRGIDRYVPRGGGGDRSRSRSPRPRRREGGRRPGERRGGGGGGRGDRGDRGGERGDRGERGDAGSNGGRSTRPKKTQEELDAEMEDYFGGDNGAAEEAPVAAPAEVEDDMDMIG